MRRASAILCLLLGAVLSGAACSTSEPGSPEAVFEKLGLVKDAAAAGEYYTEETRSLAEKIDGGDGGLLFSMERKLFRPGSSWKILTQTADGDDQVLRVAVTKHPQANMIGFETDIRMVREDGAWKIDRSGDLKRQLKGN